MAILTNTALDIASGRLVASVSITVPGADASTVYPVLQEAQLLSAAQTAGRSDWTTADVLSLLTSGMGMTVTAAT